MVCTAAHTTGDEFCGTQATWRAAIGLKIHATFGAHDEALRDPMIARHSASHPVGAAGTSKALGGPGEHCPLELRRSQLDDVRTYFGG